MRKHETRQETREYTYLLETTCDLCGTIAKNGYWDRSNYEVNETEIEVKIKQKQGEAYPEAGWGKEILIDMCPKCFTEKLIPWLKTQGADIQETDWDY